MPNTTDTAVRIEHDLLGTREVPAAAYCATAARAITCTYIQSSTSTWRRAPTTSTRPRCASRCGFDPHAARRDGRAATRVRSSSPVSTLVAVTPATRDEEHIPAVLASLPDIPPRVPAILADGASPLPALLDARDRLLAAGATLLAMPCNTAHHWFDALAECPVPMLHIADAALVALGAIAAAPAAIGVVATRGTLRSGFYGERLAAAGYSMLAPTEHDLAHAIEPRSWPSRRGRWRRAARASSAPRRPWPSVGRMR